MPHQRLTLRPHQESAARDILSTLRETDRAVYVSACGTGKTLVLTELVSRLNPQVTVVCAPWLSLLQQLHAAFTRQLPDVRTAFVCSADDLKQHGTGAIHDLLAETDPRPLLIFSTYQSLGLTRAALNAAGLVAGLLIGDEAHHLATTSAFGQDAVSDEFPASKRVFATATPRLCSADDSGVMQLDASMDNSERYGPVAHELTFGAAIKAGIIADYSLAVLATNSREIAAKIEHDADLRLAAAIVAVQRLREQQSANRIVAVLNRVDRAREFAALAHRSGIPAHLVVGETAPSERLDVLDEFARTGGVLVNVRCLAEGVDLPELDGLIFVDPRQSVVDLAQNIGRAIRLKRDGRRGIIAVPVVVDAEAESVDGQLPEGYETLAGVLSVLRELDERLAGSVPVSTGFCRQQAGSTPQGGEHPIVEVDGSDVSATQWLRQVLEVRLLTDLRMLSFDELMEYEAHRA